MARKKDEFAPKKKKGRIENLTFNQTATPERRRQVASKAGKASAAKAKARKTLREELLALLSDGNIQQRMSLAIINEAINGNNKGSVTKAFEVIRDTIGEKPVDKVMIAEVDQNVIDEVEKMMEDDDEETSC